MFNVNGVSIIEHEVCAAGLMLDIDLYNVEHVYRLIKELLGMACSWGMFILRHQIHVFLYCERSSRSRHFVNVNNLAASQGI